MNEIYFLDAYALMEILRQNPVFKPFAHVKFVTTKLNLFEVYRKLLINYGEETAGPFLENYYPHARPLDRKMLRTAVHLKLQKKRLTVNDCIGYALARRLNIPFLTGDSAFQDMEGVEYVK